MKKIKKLALSGVVMFSFYNVMAGGQRVFADDNTGPLKLTCTVSNCGDELAFLWVRVTNVSSNALRIAANDLDRNKLGYSYETSNGNPITTNDFTGHVRLPGYQVHVYGKTRPTNTVALATGETFDKRIALSPDDKFRKALCSSNLVEISFDIHIEVEGGGMRPLPLHSFAKKL